MGEAIYPVMYCCGCNPMLFGSCSNWISIEFYVINCYQHVLFCPSFDSIYFLDLSCTLNCGWWWNNNIYLFHKIILNISRSIVVIQILGHPHLMKYIVARHPWSLVSLFSLYEQRYWLLAWLPQLTQFLHRHILNTDDALKYKVWDYLFS